MKWGTRWLCDIKMKSNLQSRNKCQNYYYFQPCIWMWILVQCNGTLPKRSKFVRVIFIRYKKKKKKKKKKKTFSWRRGETIQKPVSISIFDNVFKTLIERFIKTKPNWNQYETFWKRFVFAGICVGF